MEPGSEGVGGHRNVADLRFTKCCANDSLCLIIILLGSRLDLISLPSPRSGTHLQAHKEGCERLREIDVSHVLAEAVRRSHFGESVSALFTSVPWTEAIRLDYAQSAEEAENVKVNVETNKGVVRV